MRLNYFSYTLIVIALVLSCNRSDDRKALEVYSPCGTCPDSRMKCIANECQCPDGYYMDGIFCHEKTENTYTASFENTPFYCKKSGIIEMPELAVDFTDKYDFGILFSDGSVAQSTGAHYYKNPEYELVTDEYFWLPGPLAGICDGNGVYTASIVAKRNVGSDEISIFLKAYDKNIDDVVDTFTLVFRK